HERLQVVDGQLVVLVGAFEGGQGEAVAGGVGLLVAAVLLQKLGEAGDGEGVVLLVVGPAGAVQEHVGGLVGRHLGVGGRGGEQDGGQQGEEAETGGAVGEKGKDPANLLG